MTYEDNVREAVEEDRKQLNEDIDKILDEDIPDIDNYQKANSESLFRDKYKPYSVLAFISTFVVLVLVLGILIVLMINN